MCVLYASLQSVHLKSFAMINTYEAKLKMCSETHVDVHVKCLILLYSCKKKISNRLTNFSSITL